MNIVVIIPTYNERENIAGIVRRVLAIAPEFRILVVDDASPDGTADEVRTLQRTFPQLELLSRSGERGFGSAYLAGFRWALARPEFDAVLMMDADHSHDPAHIPALRERLLTSDIVVGSRYTKGGGVDGWELWRRLLSRGGNSYVRCVTGMRLKDCTSGFNLIRASVLRKLDLDTIDCSGYAFLTELKHAIWESGAMIAEVPIIFRNRAGGESKISGHIIREGIMAPWRMRNKAILRQPLPKQS
jgi:dolichol-phosphate mannosyltransferase